MIQNSTVVAMGINFITEEFLNKWGPLLVSSFKVHTDFQKEGDFCYRDSFAGAFVGLHAMVLIGTHIDPEDGKRHFLLQNW